MEHYPDKAGWKARQTAKEAAEGADKKAPRLRRLCKQRLALTGPSTADECAALLQEDKLSIRPRFSELVALGEIEDSGFRRKNASGRMAVVWRLKKDAHRLAGGA